MSDTHSFEALARILAEQRGSLSPEEPPQESFAVNLLMLGYVVNTLTQVELDVLGVSEATAIVYDDQTFIVCGEGTEIDPYFIHPQSHTLGTQYATNSLKNEYTLQILLQETLECALPPLSEMNDSPANRNYYLRYGTLTIGFQSSGFPIARPDRQLSRTRADQMES